MCCWSFRFLFFSVVFLKDHKVAEQGPYIELMAAKQQFAALMDEVCTCSLAEVFVAI